MQSICMHFINISLGEFERDIKMVNILLFNIVRFDSMYDDLTHCASVCIYDIKELFMRLVYFCV